MTGSSMRLERASAADVPAVEALLSAADLPLDGAADAVASLGVVARDAAGAVVGAAALERFGSAGLLRSVVVAPAARGLGVGRAVVEEAERLAAAEGMDDLYLITETAEAWFPRLGWTPVPRSVAQAAVGESIEFTTVCRDKGVPMRRLRP